jgi:hypothetical protein
MEAERSKDSFVINDTEYPLKGAIVEQATSEEKEPRFYKVTTLQCNEGEKRHFPINMILKKTGKRYNIFYVEDETTLNVKSEKLFELLKQTDVEITENILSKFKHLNF